MQRVAMIFLLVPLWLWAQTIEIKADRESSVYQIGEQASFSVLVKDAEGQAATVGTVNIRLDNFGPNLITNGVFDLATANPVALAGTLREPGFMRCNVTAKVKEQSVKKLFGVGFSPEKITSGGERPADFDAFWDAAIKRLEAEVPLDAKIERMEQHCSNQVESFRVSFATFGGKRVYGFLSVPKGAGPFPVLVNVPGAGPGVVGPNAQLASRGFITLVMNVHPFEPAADAGAQQRLYEEQDKRLKEQYGSIRYCHSGATQRESYFFYPIILGINRAVNWLAARADVDGSNFLYSGSSQGGGFGFYLCGLNRNFTKGVIHVPALTDLLGFQKQHESGWPKLIESLPAADKAAATKVAPYFDGAHFASRITCPVRVSVGFIDTTCPPAAVYAGYNALTVKDKGIVHGLIMPHAVFPEVRRQLDQEWLGLK